MPSSCWRIEAVVYPPPKEEILRARISGIILASILALAGCTSTTASESGPAENVGSGAMPKFTGPFAVDLSTAWTDSDNEFVQSTLADQTIDDQEWAELSTRMSSCLSKDGVEFLGFRDDGTYETHGPVGATNQEAEDILARCEAWSGETWLHPLRRKMATNPENTPFPEAMTQCLIRNKLVPTDYAVADFIRDNQALSFPFMGTSDEEEFWSCNSDTSYDGAS